MAIVRREYINPLWENADKQRIMCVIRAHHDDGSTEDAQAIIANPSGDNPDWNAIMEEYGQEYLDKILDDAREKNKERQKRDLADRKRQEERQKQEKLFARKLEIFEVDEIRQSKDRAAKASIRKAKSETEAILRAAALLNKEQANTNE